MGGQAALIFCLSLLIPTFHSRLYTFVGNTTHIVTYDTSPDGHLNYLSAHQNIADSVWLSVYPTYNPYLLLSTGDAPDGNGTVYLYNINPNNGVVTRRSEQNSSGIGPAYVSWHPKGSFALVANYGGDDGNGTTVGASVAVIPVNQSSQSFGRTASVILHYGSSINPSRQAGPHPHFVAADYTGSFAFSTDLGTDQIWQYNLLENGTLTNNSVPFQQPDQLGSGPRHMAFHPSHLMAYVVNELLNTVDVYTYNSKLGQLDSLVQSISTLPPDFTGDSAAAEVVITPDGRFLYASNRGYDSIVGFYIDPTSTDFNLKRISFTTHRISTPRNFAIDPAGRLLLVGCSTTNEIVAFTIQNDGTLVPTGAVTSIADAISIVISEIN